MTGASSTRARTRGNRLCPPSRHGPVTLVYSSHDTEHNNAVALREYLEAKVHRSPRAAAADRSAAAIHAMTGHGTRPPLTFIIRPVPPFRLDLTAWALRRRARNVIDRWMAPATGGSFGSADGRPKSSFDRRGHRSSPA